MNPDTRSFEGILAGEMMDFLRHQRALGKRFVNEERGLRLFDQYLVEQKVGAIEKVTPEVIEAFLASRPRARPRSYNHLLSVVGRLFKWLVRQGRVPQSPVQSRPRHATAAQVTFLFDRSQARQLLKAAAELPDNNNGRNRGRIYFMIFALMYGLGLRVGEVARLRREDVDLERKVLVIRETKFLKSRLVPFGPKIEARLREYLQQQGEREGTAGPTTPLFSFDPDGSKTINPTTITQTFHALWPRLGLKISAGTAPPRLHCLRHSFAVGTLLRWYRSGINPQQRLWDLSTFMGHVHPASTAVYLTITAELLDQANQRFNHFAAPLLKGVAE
jgi:site-specific recombinase XerD